MDEHKAEPSTKSCRTRRTRSAARIVAGLLVALGGVLLPGEAAAQVALNLEVGEQAGSVSARLVQLFVLLTVLSLAPGIVMMATCFPFMVIVLSILRQALGVPQAPPNMMMVSLALFLTFFVMEPVFTQSWNEGVGPFLEGEIAEAEAIERTVAPLRDYMQARVDQENAGAMLELARARADAEGRLPLTALLPAYMITEIERGFQFGFLIFLPFIVIDLVVASILMSMGMMMLPPVLVALPFKLAFFTLSDGWSLIASAMVRSYGGIETP